MIPVNTPLLEGNEKQYLIECVDTGWISSEGPFVTSFEEKFAKTVNRKYGIAVCNGTAALEVAIISLGIGRGDEVILPTFTIISCAAAIVRAGAIPVVVDCDPLTWNMDIDQLEEKITKRTKAIMVVHIYGLPVDMDPVIKLAKHNDLKIIEDAAEMHGQTYRDNPCGSFGDLSTFSFYPNKHITTGEGGMIVTNDEKISEKCRSLRNLSFQKKRRFVHEELGWNYRFTNIQAALGLAQLEQFDRFVKRKREIGSRYNELLQNLPGLQLPLEQTDYADNIYWVYGVVIKEQNDFDALYVMNKLSEKSIGTRPFFYPMHLQPVFKKMNLFNNVKCPVSEKIAERGFYLPSGLGLSDNEIDIVVSKIYEVLT